MSLRIVSIVLGLIVILLLSTFPGWHEELDEEGSEREVRPFPSRPVSQVALLLSFLSCLLLLISATWAHVGSVAFAASVDSTEYVRLKTSLGTANLALTWVAFSSMVILTFGLLIMIVSVALLDRLVDEDDYSLRDTPESRPRDQQASQSNQQHQQLLPQVDQSKSQMPPSDPPVQSKGASQMTGRRRWDGDE